MLYNILLFLVCLITMPIHAMEKDDDFIPEIPIEIPEIPVNPRPKIPHVPHHSHNHHNASLLDELLGRDDVVPLHPTGAHLGHKPASQNTLFDLQTLSALAPISLAMYCYNEFPRITMITLGALLLYVVTNSKNIGRFKKLRSHMHWLWVKIHRLIGKKNTLEIRPLSPNN